jgi:RecG-like helicase
MGGLQGASARPRPGAIPLDSPLADLIDAASFAKLATLAPVSSVADLVGTMPLGYWESIECVAIGNLQTGCEAVVRGRIVSREGRPTTRTSRDGALMYPVVVISDGTGDLKAGFIRVALPAGLAPGTHVVVRGKPRRIEIPRLVRKVVAFEMDDPLIAMLTPAEMGLPTPLFDAPAAIYHDDRTTSGLMQECVSIALHAILPLPSVINLANGDSFSGEILAAALRAIHRPDTTAERDWGWDQREWAHSVLAGVGRP